MVTALCYRRVSGVIQEDNSSLEKQRERMETYCFEHEYETADALLFTEVMTAVETFRERPQLNSLFTKAEELAPHTEVVVLFDHPDRAARGLDLILIIEYLRSVGARVEFVQQTFADDDIGKIVLHMQSWSSKQEWNRIKKRTQDGLIDRVVKDHKILGSVPLYGYKWDDPSPKAKNRYVCNDDPVCTDADGIVWSERKVVAYIFQQAKEGVTLYKIAQSLNTLGIPTRQRFGNNTWHVSRISAILSNPKYMGKYYAFNQRYQRMGKKYVRGKQPFHAPVLMPEDACPALIDEQTWEVVQVQLEYNKKNSPRNARHPELALCRNRVARCAYCGGAMGFKSNEGRVRYHCLKAGAKKGCGEANFISASLVDDAVWKRCCAVINNPVEMRQAIEALRSPNPVEKQEKPLAQQRQEIETEIDEYVDLLHDAKTEITKKRTRSWITHLEEQLAEIEQQEQILSGIKKNWRQAEEEIHKFELWCAVQRENLDTATYSQKRTCVEFLGVRVKIFKFGSRPRLTIDFAPPNIMEALSGVQKKGVLTLDTQQATNSKPLFFLTFEEFLEAG